MAAPARAWLLTTSPRFASVRYQVLLPERLPVANPIFAELIEKYGTGITSTDVLSYAMYPKVFEEFREWTEKYGDLS